MNTKQAKSLCLQGIEKLKKQREEINTVAKDNNKKYLLVYSKRYKKVKKKQKNDKKAKQKPSVNCEDKGKLSFYKNRIKVFKKETEILKKLES